MKQLKLPLSILLIISASFFNSCKSKTTTTEPTVTATDSMTAMPSTPPAPTVALANDDELKKGVSDATKDYTDLKAEVADSVIILSGSIKRADWQKLNPTLNSLHPKRVNSTQLTIK